MSAEKPNAERLQARITDYLTTGGFFNPEMAEHFVVRDLLIECRDALQPVPSAVGQPSLEKLRELEADLRNAKCEGPPEIVKATLEGMHHIADRLRAVLAAFEKEGK